MADFLGIGVQKAGTTWIYHHLSLNPQITFPCGKEIHYWDRISAASGQDHANWIQALAPSQKTTTDGRPIRAGEITPAYALLPVTTIEAIRKLCPDIRLFISLRNPIERAWSAALAGLSRAEMYVYEASDSWFIDHFYSAGSIGRGDYVGCIQRWQGVFPNDQLLIFLHDEIASTPTTLLGKLSAHLRIDSLPYAAGCSQEGLKRLVVPLPQSVPPKYRIQQWTPLRPSLMDLLQSLYSNQIDRLQSLLNRDLSHWKDYPIALTPDQVQDRIEINVSPSIRNLWATMV